MTQLAGEAVRDGQFLVNEGTSMKRGLKCIGICPWGYIHNTKALVNDEVGEFHAARYGLAMISYGFSRNTLY